jgi:hypothetical protein
VVEKTLDKCPASPIHKQKIKENDTVKTYDPAVRPANAEIQPNSVFWFYFFYSGTRGDEGRV